MAIDRITLSLCLPDGGNADFDVYIPQDYLSKRYEWPERVVVHPDWPRVDVIAKPAGYFDCARHPSTTRNEVEEGYLIRSYEHEIGRKVCWWRPNELGYTTNLEEAGIYSKSLAEEIVARANYGGPIHEKAVPLSKASLEQVTQDAGDKDGS